MSSQVGKLFSTMLPSFLSTKQGFYRVSGKLIFSDNKLPVVDAKINIYVRNSMTLFKHFVGAAESDQNGDFSRQFSWSSSPLSSQQYLTLEIIEKRRIFANKHNFPGYVQESVMETKTLAPVKLSAETQLGQLQVTYNSVDRDPSKINPPAANDSPDWNYQFRFLKAALPEATKDLFIKGLLLFQKAIEWKKGAPVSPIMKAGDVQKIYDSFGPKFDKRAATLDNLIEELQNHICAVDYRLEGNQVIWSVDWAGYTFDTERSLPNVTFTAVKNADNKLKASKIEIKFREDENTHVLMVGNPNIDWGIFVCRSVFALKGEIDLHLGEGHLLPGIAAKNFHKFIKVDNPLYDVVVRYLDDLDYINWLGGKGIIFGKGSVIESSALTVDATAAAIIARVKAKANFLTARLPDPICESHVRARVAQFHYNLLYNYYRDFIASNSALLQNKIAQLYDWSKGMHLDLEEIPEIIPDNLAFGDEQKEALARCLAALVSQTTFLHWSVHSRQTLLTDLSSASICMRDFGLSNKGELAPYGNTTAEDATLQLKISRTLLAFNSRKFADYANPELLQRVKDNSAQYAPYDPLKGMFSTVEI